MSKHPILRWEWDKETGVTALGPTGAKSCITISDTTAKDRRLIVSLGKYHATENLRPTQYPHEAERQAAARLRFHLNKCMKSAFQEYAAVRRECMDLIKRPPK